jgi:hypothetical protein
VFWNEEKQAFLQRLTIVVVGGGGGFCFLNCKMVFEEGLFSKLLRFSEM